MTKTPLTDMVFLMYRNPLFVGLLWSIMCQKLEALAEIHVLQERLRELTRLMLRNIERKYPFPAAVYSEGMAVTKRILELSRVCAYRLP